MKTFARAGLATLVALALSLAATAAFAIEYDDVIGLAKQGVSDRVIVKLIVDDGRAFEMTDDEIAGLRDEDVSEDVIQAMLDPEHGQDWLDGKVTDEDSYDQGTDDSNGYSTSLDRAYKDGYDDGRSTALVYSFGYYYGPLARYYYDDPFYYPFWFSGYYSTSYWPSYCAFHYRPVYSWYSPYPYNYYDYGSYYCYTWYDPGYYSSRGYNVRPGTGRSVWDNGPRWRDGGLPASGGGGRSGSALAVFRDHVAEHPVAPPIIRQVAARAPGAPRRDLVSGTVFRDGRVTRGVSPAPRTGVVRSTEPVRRPAIDRLGDRTRPGNVRRGDGAGRMTRDGRASRPQPSWQGVRRSDRPAIDRVGGGRWGGSRGYDAPRRVERSSDARQAPPARQVFQGHEQRQPDPPPQANNAPEEQRQPEAKQPEARQPEARAPIIDRIGGRR